MFGCFPFYPSGEVRVPHANGHDDDQARVQAQSDLISCMNNMGAPWPADHKESGRKKKKCNFPLQIDYHLPVAWSNVNWQLDNLAGPFTRGNAAVSGVCVYIYINRYILKNNMCVYIYILRVFSQHYHSW